MTSKNPSAASLCFGEWVYEYRSLVSSIPKLSFANIFLPTKEEYISCACPFTSFLEKFWKQPMDLIWISCGCSYGCPLDFLRDFPWFLHTILLMPVGFVDGTSSRNCLFSTFLYDVFLFFFGGGGRRISRNGATLAVWAYGECQMRHFSISTSEVKRIFSQTPILELRTFQSWIHVNPYYYAFVYF